MEDGMSVTNAKLEQLARTDLLNKFLGDWMTEIYSMSIGQEDIKIYKVNVHMDAYIFKTIQVQVTDNEAMERVEKEYDWCVFSSEICEYIAKPIKFETVEKRTIKKRIREEIYEYSNQDILSEQFDTIDLMGKVIEAMIILHNNKIFHSDLKSTNIVIKDNKPIIMNFGVSIIFDSKIKAIKRSLMNNTTPKFTYAYYPPEVIRTNDYIPNKVDVYSWGMILYQLVTEKNEEELEREIKKFKLYADNYDQFIDMIKTMEINDKEEILIREILLLTLNEDPNKRPEFKELKQLVDSKKALYRTNLQKSIIVNIRFMHRRKVLRQN